MLRRDPSGIPVLVRLSWEDVGALSEKLDSLPCSTRWQVVLPVMTDAQLDRRRGAKHDASISESDRRGRSHAVYLNEARNDGRFEYDGAEGENCCSS